MNAAIFDFLQSRDRLVIRQQKEWVEILAQWETANRYAVMDPNGAPAAYIAERTSGFLSMLKRWVLRSHRPLDADVVGRDGERLLHLSRPFFFLFSDLEVRAAEGARIGSVRRRFAWLHKKYDLCDEHGQMFATVTSPIWRLWTFRIQDRSGARRALVSKKWGGALREIFSDADTYLVDFTGSEDSGRTPRVNAASEYPVSVNGTLVEPWTPEQKAVIFAAAISIDFDFFEDNVNR